MQNPTSNQVIMRPAYSTPAIPGLLRGRSRGCRLAVGKEGKEPPT